jgi:hypothetical protein
MLQLTYIFLMKMNNKYTDCDGDYIVAIIEMLMYLAIVGIIRNT